MPDNEPITLEELKKHTTKGDLYVLVHDKVYNVTKFIDEHPGGDEVILAEAGKDATEAFEDVGHSDEARELLPAMLVGPFAGGPGFPTKKAEAKSKAAPAAAQAASSISYFLPLAALAAYFAWRFYSPSS